MSARTAFAALFVALEEKRAAQTPQRKRKPKWCNRCSSHHAGACRLVKTAHGSWCRPEIRTHVEKREALRRMQRA